MSTLLLRLAAPLQAWGSDSKFERRTTQREPTKSGVIGLLAAALGRERDDSITDLCELKFGVRIDQPGQIVKDYHTARLFDVRGRHKHTYVTNRYYISDAVFLVGLGGNTSLLEELEVALRFPFFPIFLGRRSCPPTGRLLLGMRDLPLEESLAKEEWIASEWYKKQKKMDRLTLVLDSNVPGANRRRDVPITFSQTHRQHTYRYINDMNNEVYVEYQPRIPTEHDPFEEMEV